MELSESANQSLRAYFVPYLAPSHIFPLVDIAKLFASRGVHVTILTTHYNALLFKDSTDELCKKLGYQIHLHLVDFPAKEVGLPEGIENFSSATAEMAGQVFYAFFKLQQPMEQAIRAAKPDFILADMHCFWASDLADSLGIPRLIFHGQAYFALSADNAISKYAPHEKVESDDELFLLPGLPDPIHMCKSQMQEWVQTHNGYTDYIKKVEEGDWKSYGVIVNSFYELEPTYADFYRNNLGRRAWCIGPLPLHCDNVIGAKKEDEKKHPCMDWLDKMEAGKVLYVSFGSQTRFSAAQQLEIAAALESSGHPFIWVVRKGEESEEKWLPDGFEARIAEKNMGLLITGWAPQVMILEHPAVGGFVSHCGWNSVIESATAGVPMATWPLSAEHFYNEKLVTHVLKIGVEVGAKNWTRMVEESTGDTLEREKIEKAVCELMGQGGEAEERRKRAKEFSKAARKAVEVGGSSPTNLGALIDELQSLKASRPGK